MTPTMVQRAERLCDRYKKMYEAVTTMAGDDNYDREIVLAMVRALADLAPFMAGDRIRLRETPEINADISPGWVGSRHILVKGAPGTVTDADFGSGDFIFFVAFDRNTWVDRHGNEHSRSEKPYVYAFKASDLEKIDEPKP